MELSMARGDTARWTITAQLEGDPLDLTDASMQMFARRNFASPVLFERTTAVDDGIVIDDDPTTGKAVIQLKQEDTLQLPNELTVLVYSIHVQRTDGEWQVAFGNLTVSPIAADF